MPPPCLPSPKSIQIICPLLLPPPPPPADLMPPHPLYPSHCVLPSVIVESTYGTQLHGPREARERLFTDRIAATVRAGGRVLLPIVAIGRAQV